MKIISSIVFSFVILGLTACTPALPPTSVEKEPDAAEISTSEEVHIHAGFLVYVDGELQKFSDLKYMHIKPCDEAEHEEELTPEEEQEEKAHLHDGNGDVVHVHRPNVVWQDLFTNLLYEFPQEKDMIAYLNGERADSFLQVSIQDHDSLVIVVGDETGVDITQGVSQDRISEVSNSSESCGVK